MNEKLKWYEDTLVIGILCGLWVLIVPPILALVLYVMQKKKLRKANEVLQEYETLENLKQRTLDIKRNNEFLINEFKEEEDELKKKKRNLLNEIKSLSDSVILHHYDFSTYEGITSQECKNELTMLKQKTKDLLSNGQGIEVSSDGNKKVISNNMKQILRCFNAECDNVLVNLTAKNIDASRNKIVRSYETLNKIFEVDGMMLSHKLLDYKLEELKLIYTYELKREQEKEIQKAIKEQMVEEEKARKELENELKKLEKDQKQFQNEIERMMKYLSNATSDVEKELYADKIKELQEKANQIEERKSDIEFRQANATAGYVYVISNIGSFGEDIYKIGMTRRLEPMDRVRELSNASVPFPFDVHAMIFAENAPELESSLHEVFKGNSVNKVNYRKEFFHVNLEEIETVVKEKFSGVAEFTKLPVATEYRETLRINNNAQ